MLRCSIMICLATGAGISCGGASTPGRSSAALARDPRPVTVPAARPAAIQGAEGRIALTTLAGAPTTLAAHGAKVTVVALWATFCAPCIEELPYVDALYQKYKDSRDVAVLAINIDDVDDPKVMADVRAIVPPLGLAMPSFIRGEKGMAP